jgi:hypothetical protein
VTACSIFSSKIIFWYMSTRCTGGQMIL